jgi:hypothetical protein
LSRRSPAAAIGGRRELHGHPDGSYLLAKALISRGTGRIFEQEQLAKFDGERWVLFGEIFDAFRK